MRVLMLMWAPTWNPGVSFARRSFLARGEGTDPPVKRPTVTWLVVATVGAVIVGTDAPALATTSICVVEPSPSHGTGSLTALLASSSALSTSDVWAVGSDNRG